MTCLRSILGVLVAAAFAPGCGPVSTYGERGGDDPAPPAVDPSIHGPCEEPEAVRFCAEPEHSLQFCDYDGLQGEYVWGPCVEDVECLPGDREQCAWGGDAECELVNGVPRWDELSCDDSGTGGDQGETDTPLVLVRGDASVEYASASATTFDTFSGRCLDHDWPTADSPWLVLDRDHSGFIEDGGELFGSGTRLANGRRARNGFEALAELDADADGVISEQDAAFADLALWADADGDRRSTPGELVSLTAAGIVALPLAHTVDPRCDLAGNCERERVSVPTKDGTAMSLVDVHLACR